MQHVKQPLAIAFDKQSFDVKARISLSFLILIFSLCFFSFTGNPVTAKSATNTWVLDKVVGNVEFYHMIGECNEQKAVFLKFNNRNSYKVKISWKENFDTQFEKHVKGFSGQKQVVLSKGELIQGGCNTPHFNEGIIQPKQITPTYLAEVHAFEFVDIKVTRLQ